jgi:hypothetical protein
MLDLVNETLMADPAAALSAEAHTKKSFLFESISSLKFSQMPGERGG